MFFFLPFGIDASLSNLSNIPMTSINFFLIILYTYIEFRSTHQSTEIDKATETCPTIAEDGQVINTCHLANEISAEYYEVVDNSIN